MAKPRKNHDASPAQLPDTAPKAWTRKQWADSPKLQAELQALLDHPVMRMAFQTLLHVAMPNGSPSLPLIPGVSAEAMAYADAAKYHNRSGFTQFQRALNALARPIDGKGGRAADWGALQPEEE